ncbi:MAG TPA: TQO small subunit DoxD [Terriglobales bacterium]|nr:TQO small subunit DoxD [Terriglobales bacterium]
MTTIATSLQNDVTTVTHQPQAANGLAIVRLTIGAMFVWVFIENLGKGLYRPAGYAGLINYYIKQGHSPAAWKAVMGLAANHAAMAAAMQAMTEISLGILLVIGLLTRPVAFVAFLYLGSLWISEWGTAWIWELLVPVLASLGLAIGRAGRRWGVDAWLSQRWPSSPWW